MFQFPGFPSAHYGFMYGYAGSSRVGFPIRISPDRWIFAPPRSFSQLVTSFIGSQCQGIHPAPFMLDLFGPGAIALAPRSLHEFACALPFKEGRLRRPRIAAPACGSGFLITALPCRPRMSFSYLAFLYPSRFPCDGLATSCLRHSVTAILTCTCSLCPASAGKPACRPSPASARSGFRIWICFCMRFSRYVRQAGPHPRSPALLGPGGRLFSHTVSSAVPSAACGLTGVFGMGTGVSRKRITTRKFRDIQGSAQAVRARTGSLLPGPVPAGCISGAAATEEHCSEARLRCFPLIPQQ